METELITVAEYAKRNGISPSAVYKRSKQAFVEIDGRKFIRVKVGENETVSAVSEDSNGVTVESLQEEVRHLLEERSRLLTLEENHRTVTSSWSDRCKAAESDRDRLQEELNGLQEELTAAKAKVEELQNQLQDLTTKCAVAESLAQERFSTLSWLQGEYQQMQARLEAPKGFFGRLFGKK